jgi:uncharacterized protein (UPF0261 family)
VGEDVLFVAAGIVSIVAGLGVLLNRRVVDRWTASVMGTVFGRRAQNPRQSSIGLTFFGVMCIFVGVCIILIFGLS